MARYTKKDSEGRYYIESVNGKLESNIKGYTYGEAIDRFAEFENADVVSKSEIEKIFAEIELFLNKAIDGWSKERKFAYNDRQIEMIDFRNDAFKYCLHEIAELKKKYITE